MTEWRDISTAPKDGSWFIINRLGENYYEVGRYKKPEERTGYEWEGFSNFCHATRWKPIAPLEEEE